MIYLSHHKNAKKPIKHLIKIKPKPFISRMRESTHFTKSKSNRLGLTSKIMVVFWGRGGVQLSAWGFIFPVAKQPILALFL